MANGSGEPEKPAESKPAVSKGPSLFERVTGTGRAAKAAAEPATPVTGSPEVAEMAVDNQSGMGGLDAADRISGSQSEEDFWIFQPSCAVRRTDRRALREGNNR
jgi:hypothetical protein